uniref:Uncharacterized protein n=1 Tax=Vitis vinifera TaxID=29760 RepID=A5BE51_VITVI|nr:hypothetical protein VITISV_020533 [Vitis vinifera]
MGFDTIFHGEISVRRYFMEKYRSGDISGILARNWRFLAINRRFFGDISRGQRGSTKVRPRYSAVNAPTRYSDATVPHLYLLLRGFEPQTKRFGFHPLTTWAKLPFDI